KKWTKGTGPPEEKPFSDSAPTPPARHRAGQTRNELRRESNWQCPPKIKHLVIRNYLHPPPTSMRGGCFRPERVRFGATTNVSPAIVSANDSCTLYGASITLPTAS